MSGPVACAFDEAAVPGTAVKETKTDESNGRVPISPKLQSELGAYIRAARITETRQFLFPSQAGTAMNHENYLERVLKPIARRAGVPNVNFQVLRRTVATHMQNHGSVKSAQAILRHVDASTTLKHYQKITDEHVIKTAESWDAELLKEVTFDKTRE
jgi:integrase